jgi:hypothetical protein
MNTRITTIYLFLLAAICCHGQLVDRTLAPNTVNEGIAKSLEEQVGAGRGNVNTPNSSSFLISRDPFRAVRRGRQLFQRKFYRRDGAEGTIYARDGKGDINTRGAIGAGLADSCAACHGRPKGGAGFGGAVVTRPDSRDAPHLFGLGLKEMLADEITAELRERRRLAIAEATATASIVTRPLTAKGIDYGTITVRPDGSVDTSKIHGVPEDLRVRPLMAHGSIISIREFMNAAMNNENGMQNWDPELTNAVDKRARLVTPTGMVLDGRLDKLNRPPEPDPTPVPSGQRPRNQLDTAVVDYLEIYMLNEVKPALYQQTAAAIRGRQVLDQVGCTSCHIADLQIDRDRRMFDVETVYDPSRGGFNGLFSTVTMLFKEVAEGRAGYPARKEPKLEPFLVKNIFTDFKLHDLGPGFWERNYDGSYRKLFMTAALWGVGTTPPYGHDGRSSNLQEVILRHGGEAQAVRDRYAALSEAQKEDLHAFLMSLILFPPDDTASNLDPGDPSAPGYPQVKQGSIRLSTLFNNPEDIE